MIARDRGVLVWGWVTSALVALGVRALVWLVPPATEMLRPAYVLALVPGLLGTWRWLRPRRTADRRTGDRRHGARRGPRRGD